MNFNEMVPVSSYHSVTVLDNVISTDTASLGHPTAGQRPLPTTSTLLDLGRKWTTGCWFCAARPAIFHGLPRCLLAVSGLQKVIIFVISNSSKIQTL